MPSGSASWWAAGRACRRWSRRLGDYSLRGVLTDLLDLGLPAPTWVAAFLVGYIAIVGPGQYLVLRRMDRREWAWFGFPLVAVGSGRPVAGRRGWLRGPEIRLAAISIARVGEGVSRRAARYLHGCGGARRAAATI